MMTFRAQHITLVKQPRWLCLLCSALVLSLGRAADSHPTLPQALPAQIGREVAIARNLQNGEEFNVSAAYLLSYGSSLFTANWTIQEGQGRPLLKGTGKPLSDPNSPLVFPRNMNRLSGPDANSC